MKYDYVTLYNKNTAFYEKRPRGKKALLAYNAVAPFAFALGYLVLLFYGITELSPKKVALLFFAPACALLGVTVLRITANRPRPYEKEGAGILPLRKKASKGKSFPSRHLASAAVISVCFLPYFPFVGGLFLLASVTLGYARFAAGWHYPSDLLAGFLLGIFCGGFAFVL